MGYMKQGLFNISAAAVALLAMSCKATDADAQAKALMTISEFAERICNTVPHEGSADSLQLSGKAKAQLSGVVKKLADLGIEGSAQYSSNDYKSVLQTDLARALKDNATCKEHVFELLNDKMVSGNSVGNVVHGNNNVVSAGQSGGITANTVNIAPPQRHVDGAVAQQLRNMLSKGAKISVISVNENEAIQFAGEINSFLRENGYAVADGPSIGFFTAPVWGQTIQPQGDGYQVVIGSVH